MSSNSSNTNNSMRRWRGLVMLVRDAVEHGSRAIERVQIDSANRPFTILEHIPAIATPTKVVHVAHDVTVKVVHGMIRGVNAIVGTSVDVVLEQAEGKLGGSGESGDSADSDSASDHGGDDDSVSGANG